MSNVIYPSSLEQCKELMQKGVVILDFYAEWCGPCKAIAPLLDEISMDFLDKVRVIKVDVENSALRPLVAKYGVRGIPTTMFIRDGEVASAMVGIAPKQKFIDLINKL
ncbi:Thioredoxin C-1 [compost metagenome]